MKKLLAFAAAGLFCVGCTAEQTPAPVPAPTTHSAPGGMHGEPPVGSAENPGDATPGEPTPADPAAPADPADPAAPADPANP